MDLHSLARLAVQRGASDILFHEGRQPFARILGAMEPLTPYPISPIVLDELWEYCGISPAERNRDASVVLAGDHRFRVNLFSQLGSRGAVLRHIRTDVPSLERLGLPADLLHRWVNRPSGLVLISGPTGSGKSTTLAACIQRINETSQRHVVTVEDPIEFVFTPVKSVITQRDVGIDTPSFADGLRQAVRQAPDVIMIGEIRDQASSITAIHAAETGRLVLATVHGGRAQDAIERLHQLLPDAERAAYGKILAAQLIGTVTQRLLESRDGGVVLAAEYFENAGATRRYIEEMRLGDLAEFIHRSPADSAQSLINALVELCRAGKLSDEIAMAATDNPAELTRALRGISSQSSRR